MPPYVTKGAIEAILNGKKPEKPEVQVLKMMRVSLPGHSNSYYYKLVLSDGQTSYPNCLLPKHKNFMIETGGEYSILRLKKYDKKPSLGPLPDIHLSDVALIQSGCSYRKKIGDPVPYQNDKPLNKQTEPKKEVLKVPESKPTSKEEESSKSSKQEKKKPLEESKKDNVRTDTNKDAPKTDKTAKKKIDEDHTKDVKNTKEERNTKQKKDTKVEKKENTKTDANNNNSVSELEKKYDGIMNDICPEISKDMTSQKIEDYVCDIVTTIQLGDISDLEDIMDKLSRMEFHPNTSHNINYQKVIQCLGEIGIEELIHVIRQTAFICCETHRQTHLYPYLGLLYRLMNSVNVIKRVLYHRATLIPLLLKSLKLKESTDTINMIIQILYLFIIVGTRQIAETYYRKGLMPLLAGIAIESSEPELLGIVEIMVDYGDRNIRQAIKKSHLLYELKTYGDPYEAERVMELKNTIRSGKWPCLSKEGAESARSRLTTELGPVELYCSSPKCRKNISLGSYKYCGACKLSRYCNVECQEYHWSVGHRHRCLKLEYIIDFYNQKK